MLEAWLTYLFITRIGFNLIASYQYLQGQCTGEEAVKEIIIFSIPIVGEFFAFRQCWQELKSHI